MRIAIVSAPTDFPTTDAREVAARTEALATSLARSGHEVVVYSRRTDSAAPDEDRTASGVTHRRLASGPARPLKEQDLSGRMSNFGRALAAQWSQDTPDVVHAYSWTSGLAATAARQQLRESALVGGGASQPPVPVVLTLTGFAADLRRRPDLVARAGFTDATLSNRIRLEVALARSVDAVVAGSDDEVEEFSRMGVPRERITMVPGGVDTDRFEPNGPTAERSDEPRLVVLGDLTPASGLETVIAALRSLPGTELVVRATTTAKKTGTEERARLRAGASQLGVADRVTFVDEDADRTDPTHRPALLRSADAVVCVPWHGPAGAGPVLEAMACGVPVVVTAVGALSDVVVDGVTGVHVAPRRPDQLAFAIRSLLGDPVRRLGFGVAGADRARSRYEWERVAAITERVYTRLLPVVPEEESTTADGPADADAPEDAAEPLRAEGQTLTRATD